MRDTSPGPQPPASQDFSAVAARSVRGAVPRHPIGAAATVLLLLGSAACAAEQAGAGSEAGKAMWLWQGILVTQAVAGIVWAVSAMIRGNRSTSSPQSGAVAPQTAQNEFQTRAAAEKLEAYIAVRLDRQDQQIRQISTEIRETREVDLRLAEERAVRIHNRIDELNAELASMPAKIIAVLANTGALAKRGDNGTD